MADGVEKICAGCGKPIWVIEEQTVCVCGAPYHKKCWCALQVCSRCGILLREVSFQKRTSTSK